MKPKTIVCSLGLTIVMGLLLWVGVALAQHETGTQVNAPQAYVSYPDTTLTAGTTVQVLPADPARVTAVCENVGGANSARIGDSGIGAGQGTLLTAGAGLTLDTTSALFAYSQNGTSINCAEIIRQ